MLGHAENVARGKETSFDVTNRSGVVPNSFGNGVSGMKDIMVFLNAFCYINKSTHFFANVYKHGVTSDEQGGIGPVGEHGPIDELYASQALSGRMA